MVLANTAILAVVPPQRSLYFSSSCIPNFDSLVVTAAGEHGSIGAPRNRRDTTVKYSTVSTNKRLFIKRKDFNERDNSQNRDTKCRCVLIDRIEPIFDSNPRATSEANPFPALESRIISE